MHSRLKFSDSGAAHADAWDTDAETPSDSEAPSEEGLKDDSPSAEVTALCWCAAKVGVARFLCSECRIEVFEVPVYMVAGESVRHGRRRSEAGAVARLGGVSREERLDCTNATGSSGDVRIVSPEDIPPSLLSLVRYLEVHQPQVLLPHTGCEALGDLVSLVSRRTPIEVIRLSSTSAFCGAEALRRLAAMYPAMEAELVTRFHVEKVAMMRSMAALLQFVATVQSNVADVVERDVLHALYLEDACAEVLQITRSERHPSCSQGRRGAKEGFSLKGLLSATESAQGRAMLRQWMALPCCDLAEIDARQSVVAFFANPLHHDVAARLRVALHRVHSTTHLFTLMRSGRALHAHYVSLYHTLQGIIAVHELLQSIAHEVPRLYVLLESIDVAPLRAMASSLAATVVRVAARRRSSSNGCFDTRRRQCCESDGAEAVAALPRPSYSCSPVRNAVGINDGVDAVLDALRVRFHELQFSLQAKAEEAFAALPWPLRARLSLRCTYTVPHGYLLCVPVAELAAVLPECAPQTDWDVASRSEEGLEEEGLLSSQHATGAVTEEQRTSERAAVVPYAVNQERVRYVMAQSFGWQLHHETQTGEYAFKSTAMEELDTWVGNLQRRVQQREEQVRRALDTSLLYNSLHLLRPTRVLGELDCLLCFARVSAQEGWCRPELVAATVNPSDAHEETGVLEIEDGWHPLLSRHLGIQLLIPFSLRMRTSTDGVCLILGVNGSGKSVLMGAVAHIVFLAHVGCHVPAASARMSLVSSIFAPSSYSSVSPPAAAASAWASTGCSEASPSSFYGECVSLHRVLHYVSGQQRASRVRDGGSSEGGLSAEGRALILIDEFGRGTSPEDGTALLKATLRYFATCGEVDGLCDAASPSHRWARVPLVLCATHLVEVLSAPRRYLSSALLNKARSTFTSENVSKTANVTRASAETVCECKEAPLEKHRPPAERRPMTDPPLPLERVKIYEMATHATYATGRNDDSLKEDAAVSLQSRQGDANSVSLAPSDTPGTSSNRAAWLPLDVTPTYQPVCITSHPGSRRRDDWEHHRKTQLDAGPAIGRQCGLEPELLEHWETALRVLHQP